MKRFLHSLLFSLLAILLMPADGLARSRNHHTGATIQASTSNSGLALLSSPGFAEIVSGPRGLRKIKLRRDEQLLSIEETNRGLVAAGVSRSDERWQLVIIEADRHGVRRLPVPAAREAIRVRPVPLVLNGELIAAAWLEGPDLGQLRVRFADWDGSGWGTPETVSSRSAGSQTGLAGTVLEDGSTLLVWSQFDGSDDELFFSWRDNFEWSSPARVSRDNAYPDITPSVIFEGDGAVAAWSRFDGTSYRVWTARFRQGEWVRERPAGTSNSLYPQLLHQRDDLYLVTRLSSPRGWEIALTNGNGRPVSRTFVGSEPQARPIVKTSPGGSLNLDWPSLGQKATVLLERVR